MIEVAPERRRRYLATCRLLALASTVAALFYLKWLLVDARPDNHFMFYLLVTAEVFNLTQALGFWYTISNQRWTEPPSADFSMSSERVDIFITTCHEPAEVVARTLAGAMSVRHPRKLVWVLDDGPSAEIELLARRYGAGYLTRQDRRAAKAGNLNHALARTNGDFVAMFDCDHVPEPEFLERTLGGFADSRTAFVQTPQVYENAAVNRVAAGAHEQQALFYGPIMRGKNARRAVFSCGTNVVFRRSALAAVGGMPEDSITEDLRVSVALLKKGYRSVYVPIVLAKGLGPMDVRAYFAQQRRWARGGLEILLKRRPFSLRMRPSTMAQFVLSFLFWFTGWAYLAYLVLPVAYLVFGLRPVQVPNQYPVYFLPYLALTLLTMVYATGFELTSRALWFALAAFPVHIAAFFSALFGRTARFSTTSKRQGRRTLWPVAPQLIAMAVLGGALVYGISRLGYSSTSMNNAAFVLGHLLIIQGFVRYALHTESRLRAPARAPKEARVPVEFVPETAEGALPEEGV
jgi:cellulose synthase (UDP-forming)